MKATKKLLTLLLTLALLLSGCGVKEPDNSGANESNSPSTITATAGGSATSGVTATIEGTAVITGTPTSTDTTASPSGDGTVVTATPTKAPTPTLKPTPTPTIQPVTKVVNLIPDKASNFDDASSVSDTGWGKIGSPTLQLSNEGYEGKCLKFDYVNSYSSAMLDLSKYIKKGGVYTISFKYMIDSDEDEINNPFQLIIRGGGENSFLEKKNDGNIYLGLDYPESGDVGDWLDAEAYFTVKSTDLGVGAPWNFGVHLISDAVSTIYIDDVCLLTEIYTDVARPVTSGQTWVSNEAVFISSKEYNDPFTDVEMDLILTNGNVTYTIPCFWDGGNIWRARFMCPTAGDWSYKTVCSDKTDSGLHNQTSKFKITAYSGTLDIYKHGFVKTVKNTRYFVYNDGTPFFYLGDTHWNLSSEPLSNIKTIADKRVAQNYTVIQSEPLGAAFDFTDGISDADIKGLRVNDEKFKYIAEKGLVHANASFFFPSSMSTFIKNNGGFTGAEIAQMTNGGGTYTHRDLSDTAKVALERICRYWAARYASYPVMWTLGQEVDNDFYFSRSSSDPGWSYVNNPYKYVAEYINKHDPYKSPLTAHQEATSHTNASNSAFRNVQSHTWYGAQWSPSLTGGSLQSIAKDYWNNGQGKPVINYEGRYCYLWTKNFGARAQGWMAYLSGMYGYGWGGQDTWSYQNTYNENVNSSDGIDTITAAEKKAATWKDSLEYPSAYQVGYMRTFFEKTVGDWYNLLPRFDDTSYLQRQSGAYAVVASNSANTKIVAYFYNFSDPSVGQTVNSKNGGTNTGTFGKLSPNAKYNYLWFDPINNCIAAQGTFTADSNGKWFAGTKTNTDMVLYIYK
jgi:hypothetical protein